MEYLPSEVLIHGIIDSIVKQSRRLSDAIHDIDTLLHRTRKKPWLDPRIVEDMWSDLLAKALSRNRRNRKIVEAVRNDSTVAMSDRQLVFLIVDSGCQRCGRPNTRKIYTQFAFRVCKTCYNTVTVLPRQLVDAGVPPAELSELPRCEDRFLRCHLRSCGKLPEALRCKVAPSAQQRHALVQSIGKKYSEQKLHQHSPTFSAWSRGLVDDADVETMRLDVFRHNVTQRVQAIVRQTYGSNYVQTVGIRDKMWYEELAGDFFGDNVLPTKDDVMRVVNKRRLEGLCQYWNSFRHRMSFEAACLLHVGLNKFVQFNVTSNECDFVRAVDEVREYCILLQNSRTADPES